LIKEDSIVTTFPNSRDCLSLKNWLSNHQRDYRFAILTAEKYRHSHANLISIIPDLIRFYIEEKFIPCSLKIYLDGRLESGERYRLRDKFLRINGIEQVVVDNFIKKNKNREGNISKRPKCPALVYYADVLANQLYSTKTFEELSKHEKLIFIR